MTTSLTVNDIGKVGVGEVRQNDLEIRMNAASRKVLHECLVGINIMESKRERGAKLEDEETSK